MPFKLKWFSCRQNVVGSYYSLSIRPLCLLIFQICFISLHSYQQYITMLAVPYSHQQWVLLLFGISHLDGCVMVSCSFNLHGVGCFVVCVHLDIHFVIDCPSFAYLTFHFDLYLLIQRISRIPSYIQVMSYVLNMCIEMIFSQWEIYIFSLLMCLLFSRSD